MQRGPQAQDEEGVTTHLVWQAVMVISFRFARSGLAVDVWLSSGQGDIRRVSWGASEENFLSLGGRGWGDTFLPKFITWIQSWTTSEKSKLRDRKLTYTQEPSGTSMKMKADMKAECKDGDHLGSWQLCFATELIDLRSKFNQNLHGLLFKPSELFHFIAHRKKLVFTWHTGVSSWGCSWVAPRGSRAPQALIWLPQGLRRSISQSSCNQPAAQYCL